MMMGGNYYILTNLLSEEETQIITSIIKHIEHGEKRVGIQQIANENFVSTTLIMKMCKRLGFDGYSELYYHLSQRVTMYHTEQRKSALCELIDNYTEAQGDAFCRLLREQRDRKIFAVGNGFSSLVADYIVQRLAVCGFMVLIAFTSTTLCCFMKAVIRCRQTSILPSSSRSPRAGRPNLF